MKILKKTIAICVLFTALFLPFQHARSAVYSNDSGGDGYSQARGAPSLAPAIALGTIALVAIVAVAISNQSHGGGHGHSH